MSSPSEGDATISILDYKGAEVFRQQFNGFSEMDLTFLAKGFYTVLVADSRGVESRKIIIQ